MSGGLRRSTSPEKRPLSLPKLPSVSELLSSTLPSGSSPPYGQGISPTPFQGAGGGSFTPDAPPLAYAQSPSSLPHRPYPHLGAPVHYGSHSPQSFSGGHSPVSYGTGERPTLPLVNPSAQITLGSHNQPLGAPIPERAEAQARYTSVSQHYGLYSEPSPGPQSTDRAKLVPRPVRKLIGEQIVPGEGLCYVYDDGSFVQKEIDGEPVNANWGVTKAGKPRKRLAIACKTCRDKKIKCEPAEPKCVQCDKSGSECHFETARIPRR